MIRELIEQKRRYDMSRDLIGGILKDCGYDQFRYEPGFGIFGYMVSGSECFGEPFDYLIKVSCVLGSSVTVMVSMRDAYEAGWLLERLGGEVSECRWYENFPLGDPDSVGNIWRAIGHLLEYLEVGND